MEEKNFILNEQDIDRLSDSEKAFYKNFIDRLDRDGVFSSYDLEKFLNIIREQYNSHDGAFRKRNAGGSEIYPFILATNLKYLMEKTLKNRNKVIAGVGSQFDEYVFKAMIDGVVSMEEIIKPYLNHKGYGINELKELLPQVEQLKTQLQTDIQFYKKFQQEKNNAKFEYQNKKQVYDNLSLFGKFAARFNGKKAELEVASQNMRFFQENVDDVRFVSDLRYDNKSTQGVIYNPAAYAEYVESQLGIEKEGRAR